MNRFKCYCIIVLTVPILFSCDEDDIVQKEHLQWEKIEFVNEGAIYAIYGNLNDVMMVSTLSKILRTTDGGKTWVEVKKVTNHIGEFQTLNDDIYAIANFKDYISHDKGETWEEVEFDHEPTRKQSSFNDSKGILYRVVHHVNGELALPTTFLRSVTKGSSWETVFPNKHQIYSWHIDEGDRVYLGVWGSVWGGQSFHSDPESKAYLYYTK